MYDHFIQIPWHKYAYNTKRPQILFYKKNPKEDWANNLKKNTKKSSVIIICMH